MLWNKYFCNKARGVMSRGVWVDKAVTSTLLDPVERMLVSNDLIAYQAGRGSHHAVSTIIPKDTVEGLKMIARDISVTMTILQSYIQ